MAKWGLITTLLYGLLLVVLTFPLIYLAFIKSDGSMTIGDAMEVYGAWQYWLIILVPIACQAVLLLLQVKYKTRRPTTSAPIIYSVIASGLLAVLLLAGGFLSLFEVYMNISGNKHASPYFFMFVMVAISWIVWCIVFFRAGKKDGEDFVTKQFNVLYKGSVLELLVAIPSHVYARQNNECCAGMLTFIGLATGLSVMLCTFGPAALILLYNRITHLTSKQSKT